MDQAPRGDPAPTGADIVANDDPRGARTSWRPARAAEAPDRWQAADRRLICVFVILVVVPVLLMATAIALTDHEGVPARLWWGAVALFALLPGLDLWSRTGRQQRGLRGVGVVEGVYTSRLVQTVATPCWAVVSYVADDGQTYRARLPLLRPVPAGTRIPLVFTGRRASRPACVASRRDQVRLTLRSCSSGLVGQCYLLCGLGAAVLLLLPAE
ncbi:hypothetical protein I6A60_32740 [Frankia sp. AgB1.9]|uniref:hypothetical protein n=1 Tax=unclassified Frankia TaxID=2632575 RepID=UPI0019317948|nr:MULTISPECIES: hypothetical protein [unclassified Frankia]MBL7492749.1 hypothetical protein [Frankia sp. AgW1.1]MBL7552593.1 hypothetical protein [Frankia sp. AgB1.9]MBL7620757.1 hypothetical protein [Frankia sp. AgB1.8]